MCRRLKNKSTDVVDKQLKSNTFIETDHSLTAGLGAQFWSLLTSFPMCTCSHYKLNVTSIRLQGEQSASYKTWCYTQCAVITKVNRNTTNVSMLCQLELTKLSTILILHCLHLSLLCRKHMQNRSNVLTIEKGNPNNNPITVMLQSGTNNGVDSK